ncbi:MAG: hypothetical protein OYH77_06260 [Pseudomonadota bacterium]|nr:hypothetical protein [Pseudomonadota bacterium]
MKLQPKFMSLAVALSLLTAVACDVENQEEIYFTGSDDITSRANPHEQEQLQSELDSLPQSVLVRTPREANMSDTSNVEVRAYDHAINLGSEQGEKQGMHLSAYFDSDYNSYYNDRIMLSYNLQRMSHNYYNSTYTYNQYLQNYYPQGYSNTHSHSHYVDRYDPHYQYNPYGNYYEPVSYVTYGLPSQYCDYFRPYYSSTVNDYYYFDRYSYVNSYYTPNYVYSYYTL